ncbi:MAG: hypothetical protein MK229_00010 [Nitrososphaerales archaeon]|nr:hypothetical protein [Nitrososphaerales archaeon]
MGKKRKSENKFQWTAGTVAIAVVLLYISRGLIATAIEGIIFLIVYIISIFAIASGAYFFLTKGDERWQSYVNNIANQIDKVIKRRIDEPDLEV